MKKLILLLSVCCFSFGALADVKTEILQDKVDRIEAELSLIQRKLYQAPQTVQSVPTQQPLSNIDELYSQIDAQNQLIQILTEKVERLEFELATLGNKVDRVNQDMDFRLSELNTQKPTEKTDIVPEKTGDKEAYDRAYDELKKGNYEVAEQAFLKFMTDYPESSLLGNANYWLGESYYARGQYAEAAGLFADGFTKYKDNTKAPDNMLKLGLTMKALNKKAEACTAFKGLASEFPKANESLKKRANEEAKALKC